MSKLKFQMKPKCQMTKRKIFEIKKFGIDLTFGF
jgi:hypothetical protein